VSAVARFAEVHQERTPEGEDSEQAHAAREVRGGHAPPEGHLAWLHWRIGALGHWGIGACGCMGALVRWRIETALRLH